MMHHCNSCRIVTKPAWSEKSADETEVNSTLGFGKRHRFDVAKEIAPFYRLKEYIKRKKAYSSGNTEILQDSCMSEITGERTPAVIGGETVCQIGISS